MVFCFCLLVSLSGCATKQYKYVSDAPRDVPMPVTNSYISTIDPGDILYIHVDAPSPEAVLPFNEETNRRAVTTLGTTGKAGETKPHGYTVASSGNILFPMLGYIHAAGLTTSQLSDTIAKIIEERELVRDPQVTVKLMNFRVTVIGEVKRPSVLESPSERLTIFEALALCGDVTMYGVRTCVTIIRTIDTVQTVDTVDLTSRELLSSPYYYLRQNDIVYVEPTERRKKQAYRTEDWIRYTTTGVQALRLAYTIVRYRTTMQRFN